MFILADLLASVLYSQLTGLPLAGKNIFQSFFAILGTTMSVNIATQEGDHGCYHYMLIYGIKPNVGKYLSNMNELN